MKKRLTFNFTRTKAQQRRMERNNKELKEAKTELKALSRRLQRRLKVLRNSK